MGMDGLYRPSESLGYTDTLGRASPAERAAASAEAAGEIHQKDKVGVVNEDGHQQQGDQDGQSKPDNAAFEEALKQKLTQRFHIEFNPQGVYRFVYNELTDHIDLIDCSTQQVILSLKPDDFVNLTENMSHQSGIMTDRSA